MEVGGFWMSDRRELADTFELVMTAHHEAGHTIYGLLSFMKIPVVMAAFGTETGGWTHYEMLDMSIQDPKIAEYLLLSEICVSYAGLIAESMHFKKICGSDKLPMILKDGSSPDIRSASELISKHNLVPSGKPRQRYKKQLCKEIAETLEGQWEDVSLVAHSLFKKKRLTYDDLCELLTRKSIDRVFWKQQFKNIDTLMNKILTEKEVSTIFNI
jgi:hypothetical protein